jgi:hypothetical protein
MNNLTATMERKLDVAQATPTRHKTLRAAADALSLRNVDAATCELMNEALARLVVLAYEQDAGGLCNVDGATGRLLIPLPWGRNGYARWGLRPQEGNILREILFAWQHDAPALFTYVAMRRSWFVNLREYANIHLAKRWLKQHQIGIGEYRGARAKRVAR